MELGRAGRCLTDLRTVPLWLQSLTMLKDGFCADRGSHSDLWSSSSSLESSGFPLPKQYLDVSSQTDISGSVSRRAHGRTSGPVPSACSHRLLPPPWGAPFSQLLAPELWHVGQGRASPGLLHPDTTWPGACACRPARKALLKDKVSSSRFCPTVRSSVLFRSSAGKKRRCPSC